MSAYPAESGPGDFDGRLRSLLRDRSLVELGSLHFINLRELSKSAGESGHALSERAKTVSRGIIERRLGVSDLLIPCDDGFLVVFAEMRKGDPAALCSSIAVEICKFFLGDSFLEQLRIGSIVRKIDSKKLIQELAGHVRSATDIFAATREEKRDSFDSSRDSENRKNSDCEKPAASIGELDFFDTGDDAAPAASAVDEDKDEAAFKIDYVFNLVWDMTREVVSAYYCEPRITHKTGMVVFGYNALLSEIDADHISDIDHQVLATGMTGITSLLNQNHRCMIRIPVHYETLASRPHARRYLDSLSMIPDSVKQYVKIRIGGIPNGVPSGRISDLSLSVRPFCRSVLLEVPWQLRLFESFRHAGGQAMGFTLPPAADKLGESNLKFWTARMADFVRRAKSIGCLTFVDGFTSLPLLAAAKESGVALATGQVIAPAEDKPQAMRRLTAENVFGNEQIKTAI